MRTIFTHRLDVRFRDCDPMGHVNNAVYLTYLEQARLAHWQALWGFGRTDTGLPGVILARVELDYKAPARFGEVLEVRMGLALVGNSSFTYEYEVVDAAGRLIAAARSVQVMYDYTAGRPVRIPAEIRRLFDAL
jgi:acyl-CoA thioester hydrolase